MAPGDIVSSGETRHPENTDNKHGNTDNKHGKWHAALLDYRRPFASTAGSHHATDANLDAQGFGDIWIMTQTEYDESSPTERLSYRLYRNRVILIGLGALFRFLLRYRRPKLLLHPSETVG